MSVLQPWFWAFVILTQVPETLHPTSFSHPTRRTVKQTKKARRLTYPGAASANGAWSYKLKTSASSFTPCPRALQLNWAPLAHKSNLLFNTLCNEFFLPHSLPYWPPMLPGITSKVNFLPFSQALLPGEPRLRQWEGRTVHSGSISVKMENLRGVWNTRERCQESQPGGGAFSHKYRCGAITKPRRVECKIDKVKDSGNM